MLRALRCHLASCTALAGVVAPGVFGRDSGAHARHACMPCHRAGFPAYARLAACERARSHTACVPGWPAPPAPCLTSADAACAASPAHPPSIPAAAGTVREVESAERVGLVVSVLHLPPGSTVHASFARSGMVQEEAEAGE